LSFATSHLLSSSLMGKELAAILKPWRGMGEGDRLATSK
jgi:hypothetical protein